MPKGGKISAPYYIPADFLGWGRGLMQIDYDASQSVAWGDPLSNIRAGAKILGQKRDRVRQLCANVGILLSDTDLEQAAVAAYNGGEKGVFNMIRSGQPPDAATKGKNYSSDVLSTVSKWS
jgi:hypothetical protein